MKSTVYCVLIISLWLSEINGIPMGKKSGGNTKADQNNKSEHTAEDDSDMLMEPDSVHPRTVLTELPETDSSTPSDTNESAAQNFYPFYRDTSSLGQARQFYSFPQQTDYQVATPNFNIPRSHDAAVLGSGDFGVIRGGTFYQDNDPPTRNIEPDYFNYYSNGHGRPHSQYFAQKYNFHDDQFANFRDFADINTPGDPAYSEFVVVYANKNATLVNNSSKSAPAKTNPKNIFEQLEMLDKEKLEEADKMSKTKLKLKNTKLEKKYQKSKLIVAKEMKQATADIEPLLALS